MPGPISNFMVIPANEADFPAIRKLIHLVQINPTGLDWRRFVVVKTDTGELIGCGQVKPHQDGTQELASIATAPNYRNQGVAGVIIRYLIDTHPGSLYLTCRSGLGGFYEKFGFSAVTPESMPPYFLRISRLASVMMKIGIMGETLLVMKRD